MVSDQAGQSEMKKNFNFAQKCQFCENMSEFKTSIFTHKITSIPHLVEYS